MGGLEENLKREVDRATALDEAHRVVQVDFVRGCEHRSGLEVVPHAREGLGAPLLNELDLDVGSFLELCRRHLASLRSGPGPSYSAARPDWMSPF